jgi:ectoine hydroxylase-related dioxygenase (phytanoyl-CoA dioxygenase family)
VIDDQDRADYERDGAVCVRGQFDQAWLDELAAGVEENFADPGPWSCVYTPEGEPGGFYDDYCNWERIDAYRRFALASPAAGIVAALMSSTEVRFYHEHVLVKEPGTRERTPWHHDQPYYGVDGFQVCSLWLPLDPVPLEACPQFVAGSHRWGRWFAPRTFVDQQPYAGAEDLEPVPDIDADPDAHELLSWALEPGDAIVFHMATVHGAPGTEGLATRRRAFSTRWLGDDARFAVRRFTTSPPFPGLTLRPGDPMDDPRFPLVAFLAGREGAH